MTEVTYLKDVNVAWALYKSLLKSTFLAIKTEGLCSPY